MNNPNNPKSKRCAKCGVSIIDKWWGQLGHNVYCKIHFYGKRKQIKHNS